MPHVEFRSNIPYVYEAYRDDSGNVKSRYLGAFDEWYTRNYNNEPAPFDVAKMINECDASDPIKLQIFEGILKRVQGISDDADILYNAKKDKILKIVKAKELKGQGKKYKEIAEELGVAKSTAWTYVNKTDF